MEAKWWYINEGDFFSGLNAEKKIFLSRSKKRAVRKNETLFTEGEAGGSVFYLCSGEVRISHMNAWGKEAIVFIRHAGEMFGLAEAIGGAIRACNARTMTECCFYEITGKEFEEILSRHWTLSKRVMEVLGSRLRYLGSQLETAMSCTVTTRLIKLLFHLGCQKIMTGDTQAESVIISTKLTQRQIAAMIGSCQQTVSEILKQLQEDGLIRISRQNREITILNPAELIGTL
jgi:CRP/FNR family transcriptional regulator